MSADAPFDAAPSGPAGNRPVSAAARADDPSKREVLYRHTLVVRVTHGLNALAIFILIGSGLNIFNAHPALYWGKKGDAFDRPFFSIHAAPGAHGLRGVTQLGAWRFDTTGVLGWSVSHGRGMNTAWPSYLTLPSYQDLADARHWHFFFAWVLAVNALIYLLWSLANRHIQRDILPTAADLRAIPRDIVDHVRLKHPKGLAAARYGVLQRLAYLGVILLVAGMILTGLTMSPGVDAAAPWLLQLWGGRQSARSLHFIFASSLTLFIVIHLVEVVLAGPINGIRGMITGRFVVPQDHPETTEMEAPAMGPLRTGPVK